MIDPAIFNTTRSFLIAPFFYSYNHFSALSNSKKSTAEKVYHFVLGLLEAIPVLNYLIASIELMLTAKLFKLDENFIKKNIQIDNQNLSLKFVFYKPTDGRIHAISFSCTKGECVLQHKSMNILWIGVSKHYTSLPVALFATEADIKEKAFQMMDTIYPILEKLAEFQEFIQKITAEAKKQEKYCDNSYQEYFQSSRNASSLYERSLTEATALQELGLPANTKPTKKELKQAFIQRMLVSHPDKGGKEEAAKKAMEARNFLEKLYGYKESQISVQDRRECDFSGFVMHHVNKSAEFFAN